MPAPLPVVVIHNAQQVEADSTLEPAFSLDSLSQPERGQAKKVAEAMSAVILKSLMRRMRPNDFHVAGGASLESRVAAAVDAIESQRFARMQPKVEAIYSNPAKLAQLLGSLAHVDLKAPNLDARVLQVNPGLIAPVAQPAGEPQLMQAQFANLTLVLRRLCCVDETNPESPGDDDIILAGIRFGASGNVAVIKGFVAGHFDDGDCQEFGSLPLGQYSLNTTPGFPKLFYCIFLLVESDSDDEELAHAITTALTIIANAAAAFTGGMGAIVAAVLQVIDMVLGVLIDDDYFPPYAIQLKLQTANAFGPSGTSKKLHTGNISAHSGTYRIGYRWELSA